MQLQSSWTSYTVVRFPSKCLKRDLQKPPGRPYLTCSWKLPSITSTVFHLLTLSKRFTFSRVRDTVPAPWWKDVKEFADMSLNYFWDTKQHYRIRQPIQLKCDFVEIHTPYFRNCLNWITSLSSIIHFTEAGFSQWDQEMVELLSMQQFYWASNFVSPDASSASSAAEASIVLNFTSIQSNNVLLMVRHACLAFRSPARQLFYFFRTLNWLQKIKYNICLKSNNTGLGRLYN